VVSRADSGTAEGENLKTREFQSKYPRVSIRSQGPSLDKLRCSGGRFKGVLMTGGLAEIRYSSSARRVDCFGKRGCLADQVSQSERKIWHSISLVSSPNRKTVSNSAWRPVFNELWDFSVEGSSKQGRRV